MPEGDRILEDDEKKVVEKRTSANVWAPLYQSVSDGFGFVLWPIRAILSLKGLFAILAIVNIAFFLSQTFDFGLEALRIRQSDDQRLTRIDGNIRALTSNTDFLRTRFASPSIALDGFTHSKNEIDCLTVAGSVLDELGYKNTELRANFRSGVKDSSTGFSYLLVTFCKGNVVTLVGNGIDPREASQFLNEFGKKMKTELGVVALSSEASEAPVIIPEILPN